MRHTHTFFGPAKLKGLQFLFFVNLIIFANACKKFVDVGAPATSTNLENVYASDATAASVLTGIYTNMNIDLVSTGNINGMSLFTGLSADELTKSSNVPDLTLDRYYKNELSTSPALSADLWPKIYRLIFYANAAIEGLNSDEAKSLTPLVKQQLLGEAKFIRAFCFFYLVNLYGDVPLPFGTDPKVNAVISRSPRQKVWEQIIVDLKEAQGQLSDSYLKSDALTEYSSDALERVRPTKWAATALLSRAYLFVGDYFNAEAEANSIINNTSLFSLIPLSEVFKKNSTEAIWQVQPVELGYNTRDAWYFNLSVEPAGVNATHPVYLSSDLINTFEIGDNRKGIWTSVYTDATGTYYYPNKYTSATFNAPVTEYNMVLRLSEQYLIRAEARAQQNNIAGAQADLNNIRSRAGLGNTTASDKASLLSAIVQERYVELFLEWGDRWLTLKRTNSVDAVMQNITSQKGGSWETTDQLYPIPLVDLQRNSHLIQNSGY